MLRAFSRYFSRHPLVAMIGGYAVAFAIVVLQRSL